MSNLAKCDRASTKDQIDPQEHGSSASRALELEWPLDRPHGGYSYEKPPNTPSTVAITEHDALVTKCRARMVNITTLFTQQGRNSKELETLVQRGRVAFNRLEMAKGNSWLKEYSSFDKHATAFEAIIFSKDFDWSILERNESDNASCQGARTT